MPYSKAFFDLQLRFAQRAAELGGMPLPQALLDYTNLYIRFGLGHAFDPAHPVWLRYVAGINSTIDHDDWTYRFFMTRPEDVAPPSLVASFGCFSYGSIGDESIRLHFRNEESHGRGPLSEACLPERRAELRALFQHAGLTMPDASRVKGTSWLYHVAGYRHLFPDAYLASAVVARHRFRHMPLWGQFLDRHGFVRERAAAELTARMAQQTTLDDIDRCFPCRPLALDAPLSAFQGFYERNRV
jgi:hypothetical protein